jgi:predicted acyltransferase (DUF342 family)
VTNDINQLAAKVGQTIFDDLREKITKQVIADINVKLAKFDIQQLVQEHVSKRLSQISSTLDFSDGSIPASAINLATLAITGNQVIGGIHSQFESTGIQDRASQCQVTILDDATVIENQIIANGALIKGDLTVEGNLHLIGEIPTDSPFFVDLVERGAGLLQMSLDKNFFAKYTDVIFNKIKDDGLDLSRLTLNGTEILVGNKLGAMVTDTNIQKLGELRSLRVNGSAEITGTVYVQNKRVGINTEEPSGALSVWDEECEVVVQKLRKNVPIIGSIRSQQVVLSSNCHDNIVLETNGSVSIKKVKIGSVLVTSSPESPKHDAPIGSIVFNETPDFGKPLLWVSLGQGRWAAPIEIN